MGDKSKVAGYNSAVYHETVERITRRGGDLHDEGRQQYSQTGRLHPYVDLSTGGPRRSINALIQREDSLWVLSSGVKLHVIYWTDGTGSFRTFMRGVFRSMEEIFGYLEGLRSQYHIDIAFGVIQDDEDPHPPAQLSEAEGNETIVQHIPKLVADGGGGDDPEEYDLGLAALAWRTQSDINLFYGLRGLSVMVGDQIGRGWVSGPGQSFRGNTIPSVYRRLGIRPTELEGVGSLPTRELMQLVLQKWHFYMLLLRHDYDRYITNWWKQIVGPSRVIEIFDGSLVTPTWAGLAYITETAQPSRDGLDHFLNSQQNKLVDKRTVSLVWDALQAAEENFGAQTRLPGYAELPKPGDLFIDRRDPWPIGHRRFSENPSQVALQPNVQPVAAKRRSGIDWKKLS